MIGTRFNWAATLQSILLGYGFFLLGSVSDVWLQQHARSRLIAMTTDALLGIAVGVLVLMYEQRQQGNVIQKLEVIRLMNHHIRNSLQVISFAATTQQQEKLAADVRSAVERIEWALREVLPGQKDDIESLSFRSPSQISAGKTTTVV
jgi:two-component sensor histidine kinase